MLGEQNLSRIMELSPYTNIRREAYDFLEGKVEPVGSLQHSFQRDIMDGSLNFFIQDIKQSGRNSQIYREFYSPIRDSASSSDYPYLKGHALFLDQTALGLRTSH